jgi:uncharacterized protein YggE
MISRRRIMLAPLALAGLMIAGVVSPVAAQESTPVVNVSPASGATIDAMGSGEAEAEASGGVLQLIVRAAFTGTPAPIEDTGKGMGTPEQPSVTEEQVNSVIAALEEGGVERDSIAYLVQPSGPYAGMFGFGAAVVAAELDQDQLAQIEEIADRAVAAGTGAGLTFDPINVAYQVGDCAAIEREALADAVADGQSQAQMLADVLGVTLGGLQSATKQQSYGGYYAAGPATSVCAQQVTIEDALRTYFPTYDPSRAGEVEIYAQVLLKYEIA